MIIAIDGPAASGNGTLGKRLAHHYGYRHLDTSVIYPAVAWSLRRGARTLGARGGGEEADEAGVLGDILKRDERDRNRPVAPLRPAPDAHTLDNSKRDIGAGVRAAIAIVEAVRAGRKPAP